MCKHQLNLPFQLLSHFLLAPQAGKTGRSTMPGTRARPKFLSTLSLIQADSETELALSHSPLGQRLADLVSHYGLKAVQRAERRLALVAPLHNLRPKTQVVNGLRVPGEGVLALAREANASVGSLYRWRTRFVKAGRAAEGDPLLARISHRKIEKGCLFLA